MNTMPKATPDTESPSSAGATPSATTPSTPATRANPQRPASTTTQSPATDSSAIAEAQAPNKTPSTPASATPTEQIRAANAIIDNLETTITIALKHGLVSKKTAESVRDEITLNRLTFAQWGNGG